MRRLGCLIFAGLLVAHAPAAAQEKLALPEGAIVQLGVHRMRVDRPILDSAFSPDGRTFVVIRDGQDGRPNVVLFDVASGLERQRLDIAGARRLAMAQDKPLMAIESHQQFEVWDLDAQKRLTKWNAPNWQGRARGLAISRDGAHVIAAGDAGGKTTLHRWDASTGAALWNVSIPARRVDSLALSADGRKILTTLMPERTSDAEAFLNAGETPVFWLGKLGGVKGLLAHNVWMLGYEFQQPVPTIADWDANTGKKHNEFLNVMEDCVFAPDGSLAVRQFRYPGSARNRRSELWRLESNPKAIADFERFQSCAFTPDGKQLVLGIDAPYRRQRGHWEIVLWDLARQQEVRRFETAEMPRTLRVSPDGKTVAIVHMDANLERYWFVEFFDLTAGKAKRFPAGHPGVVEGLVFCPDGRHLATFSRDAILVHDVQTGKELRRWVGHDNSIQRIAYSPDGKVLVSTASDGAIALWDAATGAERARMKARNYAAMLAFTPDGKTLLTATQDRPAWLEPWDLATGKAGSASMLPYDGDRFLPALSPTANWHAYLDDKSFRGLTPELSVWPTRIGYPSLAPPKENERGLKRMRTINLLRHPNVEDKAYHGTKVWAFAFSRDGKLLATSDSLNSGGELSDHAVRVWETASQREILRFHTLPIETGLLAFSPDGRTLAHGTGIPLSRQRNVEDAVFLHDLSSFAGGIGIRTSALRGHLGSITCVGFSPDSKLVATGGSDGIVYVFRVDQFVQPNPVPAWTRNLAELWPILADADPAKAHRALAQLELRPKETLTLLRKHLKPAARLDEKILAQHLRDLANPSFTIRQQAGAALENAGEQAVGALQLALQKPASLEVKRRFEALLDQLDRPLERPDPIRAYRAIMLLERLGTPEARKLLEELAQGEPTAWLSVEARHALDRLPGRP